MFGLGFTEILVILGVALLVFGPKRLPEIARTLGKTMGELRRAVDEVRFEVTNADYASLSPKNSVETVQKQLVDCPEEPPVDAAAKSSEPAAASSEDVPAQDKPSSG